MRFCVSCGAERMADARFCTDCGAAFPEPAASGASAVAPSASPSPVTKPSRTRPTPRQLRCVRCGSAIDQGLTCAACSREDAKVPVAEPAEVLTTDGVTHAEPATSDGPASPAPSSAPRPRVDAPKAEPAPSGRWVGVLTGLGLALAAGVGHWANQHPGDASRAFAHASPFGRGLDGTYDCVGPSATASLVISGSSADLQIPGLAQVKGATVERHGDTLSLKGGMAYDANGYLLDASSDPYATLATLGDDGQSITLHVEGQGDLRFLKQ